MTVPSLTPDSILSAILLAHSRAHLANSGEQWGSVVVAKEEFSTLCFGAITDIVHELRERRKEAAGIRSIPHAP